MGLELVISYQFQHIVIECDFVAVVSMLFSASWFVASPGSGLANKLKPGGIIALLDEACPNIPHAQEIHYSQFFGINFSDRLGKYIGTWVWIQCACVSASISAYGRLNKEGVSVDGLLKVKLRMRQSYEDFIEMWKWLG
ncbi:hypothetical protein K1719_003854 [Acacia pycnantha]|nr:hypothetical protein K1719_003854 [Acacia pycnantha]